MLQVQRLVDQAAADDGSATHVAAASVLRAAGWLFPCCVIITYFGVCYLLVAGVVNAEDLKRFASYFWNEESKEVVEKDEAMRCLRGFLQVYIFVCQSSHFSRVEVSTSHLLPGPA